MLAGAETETLSIVPTPGEHNTPLSFRITDAEIGRARRDTGDAEIVGCFHSHVFGRARPSRHDRAGAQTPGELWLIYSLACRRLALFEWDGADFIRQRLRIGG